MNIYSRSENKKSQHAARALLALLLALALVTPLAALDDGTPLARRVIARDGDMKLVPIWKWFNELTGDNAAVILLSPDDLGRFELHRSWRKGQTVGEVVRDVERHLGRFRVHFEDDSVSLLSLSAEEVIRLPENKDGYPAWNAYGEASVVRIGVFGAIEYNGGMSGGTCTLEASYVLSPALEAFLRADFYPMGKYGASGTGEASDPWACYAGCRWTPFPAWSVAPYVQAGLGYNKYAMTDNGGAIGDEGGVGFLGAIGLRIGGNPDSAFVTDFAVIKLSGAQISQFRIGFVFGM